MNINAGISTAKLSAELTHAYLLIASSILKHNSLSWLSVN
jgi:hypothetical protein